MAQQQMTDADRDALDHHMGWCSCRAMGLLTDHKTDRDGVWHCSAPTISRLEFDADMPAVMDATNAGLDEVTVNGRTWRYKRS